MYIKFVAYFFIMLQVSMIQSMGFLNTYFDRNVSKYNDTHNKKHYNNTCDCKEYWYETDNLSYSVRQIAELPHAKNTNDVVVGKDFVIQHVHRANENFLCVYLQAKKITKYNYATRYLYDTKFSYESLYYRVIIKRKNISEKLPIDYEQELLNVNHEKLYSDSTFGCCITLVVVPKDKKDDCYNGNYPTIWLPITLMKMQKYQKQEVDQRERLVDFSSKDYRKNVVFVPESEGRYGLYNPHREFVFRALKIELMK